MAEVTAYDLLSRALGQTIADADIRRLADLLDTGRMIRKRRSDLYEIAGLVMVRGYDSTMDFLRGLERQFDQSDLFSHPIFQGAREREGYEISILLSGELTVSGVGRCKCGNINLAFSEKQTRSADEPMTIFVRCPACGNRWTQ